MTDHDADVAAEQGVPSNASLLAAPGPPGPPSCPVCGRSISAVGGKRPVHQSWCRWTPKSRESPANDAEVAAVVAEAMRESHENVIADHSSCFLAALTAAGYAVVKLPEGVAVEHGARLVVGGRWNNVYAIEAP